MIAGSSCGANVSTNSFILTQTQTQTQTKLKKRHKQKVVRKVVCVFWRHKFALKLDEQSCSQGISDNNKNNNNESTD